MAELQIVYWRDIPASVQVRAGRRSKAARELPQRSEPEDRDDRERAPCSGKVVLDIPRDRKGTFDPMLIGKYQRRFPEFDRKIVSMYARGAPRSG